MGKAGPPVNRLSLAGSIMLAVLLHAAASAQTGPEPVAANLCDVFLSPGAYNQKMVWVEGVLSPSFHSLFLSSPSCRPKEDPDLTTEAILPPSWESLPNGKQLRKFLHRGKSASVKLIGTFEADSHRYGPDGARFRFVIREVSSVEKTPPVVRDIANTAARMNCP
jgi:hypothetical protein